MLREGFPCCRISYHLVGALATVSGSFGAACSQTCSSVHEWLEPMLSLSGPRSPLMAPVDVGKQYEHRKSVLFLLFEKSFHHLSKVAESVLNSMITQQGTLCKVAEGLHTYHRTLRIPHKSILCIAFPIVGLSLGIFGAMFGFNARVTIPPLPSI